MTTTQRSVAEIIGWERKGEMDEETFFVPRDRNDPRRQRSEWTIGAARYTPDHTADDLLAWLRERSVHRIEMHYSKGWADVIVGDTYHEAPTLLAALELAVRAVAGES